MPLHPPPPFDLAIVMRAEHYFAVNVKVKVASQSGEGEGWACNIDGSSKVPMNFLLLGGGGGASETIIYLAGHQLTLEHFQD